MKINLLEIKDEKLVKKTDKTKSLTIGGVTKEYPVYQVALKLLRHSDTSYHVASETAAFTYSREERKQLRRYGDVTGCYDEGLRRIYGDKYRYSTLYLHLMFEKRKNPVLSDYLEQLEESYMGITLPNGLVIDGNFILEELYDMQKRCEEEREKNTYRYLSVMAHMSKYFSKPDGFKSLKKGEKKKEAEVYFYTIIPDLDIEEDESLIHKLELELVYNGLNNVCCESCQDKDCEGCRNANSYNKLELCVGMFRDIVIDKKLTLEEYKAFKDKGIRYWNCDLEEYLDIVRLMYEFLKFVRLPDRYSSLSSILEHNSNDVVEEFTKLQTVLNLMEEEEKPIWKKSLFTYFVLSAAINERTDLFLAYSPLFETGNYKPYEKEMKELSERYEKRLNKEKRIPDVKSLMEITCECSDILQGMDYVIYEALEYNAARDEEYKKAIEEDAEISALDLHVRIHNSLKRAGIKTVSQLLDMEEEDIINLKNLGEKYKDRLRIIVERLRMCLE